MHPDRIDFTRIQASGKVIVTKFQRRDETADVPMEGEVKPIDFDLDGALAWCAENGYTVRQWPGGARAWRGKPWPIRSRSQIIRRRRDVERHVRYRIATGKASDENLLSLDFAYDG